MEIIMINGNRYKVGIEEVDMDFLLNGKSGFILIKTIVNVPSQNLYRDKEEYILKSVQINTKNISEIIVSEEWLEN